MKLFIDKEKINEMIENGFQTAKEGNGGPFSALIFNSDTGEVICWNSNSVLKDNDPTAHGEINTIRRACKILNKPTLEGYSLLTSNEPCPMCLSAIMWARLDNWYYIADSETAAQIGFDDIEFFKKMQLVMRMKKVKSEYEKFFKYSDAELEEKIKIAFKEYKDNERKLY